MAQNEAHNPFKAAGLELTADELTDYLWMTGCEEDRACATGNVINIKTGQPVDSGEDAAPTFLNDAEVCGEEAEGFADILNQPATLLVGEMWGQCDRRNTQDKEWSPTTLTWGQWIGGGPGDKNNPAWGFSRHPVGKDKAGACMVLGSSVGGARKAKAMDEMFAMGLDIDSGVTLDNVLNIIEEKGLFCLVYTSFNHGNRGIELKRM